MFFAIMMFGQPGVKSSTLSLDFQFMRSVINYSGAQAVPMYLSEEKNFSFNADEVLNLIMKKQDC